MKSTNLTAKIEIVCRFISMCAGYFLAVTPFIYGLTFFGYVSLKFTYINLLCQIVFVCWIILAILSKKYRPKVNLISIAVGIYVLILVLASIFGISPIDSFWSNFARSTGVILIIHLLLFFFAAQVLFDKKLWQELMGIAAIMAAAVAITIIFGSIGLFDKARAIDYSTMGNSSFLATYLVFGLFFAAYLGWTKDLKISKIWLLEQKDIQFAMKISVLLTIIGLVLSTGKAAAASSLIGLVLLFLFYLAHGNLEIKIRKIAKISLIIFLIGIIVVAIGLNVKNSFIQKMFSRIATPARSIVWEASKDLVLQKPFLGWGPETFEMAFATNAPPKLIYANTAFEYRFDRAHSVFWDHLVTTGFLGLGAYIFLFGSVFYILFRYLKRDYWLAACFICLFTAYILQNLTVFDTPTSYYFLFFCLSFLASLGKKTEDSNPKISIFKIGGILILLIGFAFGLIFFVIKPYLSSHYGVKIFAKDLTFEKRAEYYNKAVNYSPWGTRQLREYYAANIHEEFLKGDIDDKQMGIALSEFQKTRIEFPKDFYNLINLSRYAIELGKKDERWLVIAENVLADAKRINDKNVYYNWYLIDLKMAQKKYKEALGISQQVIGLEPSIPFFYNTALKAANTLDNQQLVQYYEQELQTKFDNKREEL